MRFKGFLAFIMAAVFTFAAIGCTKPDQQANAPSADTGKVVGAYINQPGEATGITLLSTGTSYASGDVSEGYRAADTAFAVNLINALDENWSGVISPLSIRVAFQLAANGGDTETMNAIMDVVCPGLTRDGANSSIASLMQMFGSSRGVHMHSAVIADSSCQISTDYANLVADCYSASVGTLDFTNPEAALIEINSWINDSTNGLIPSLFNEISSNTSVLLASTLTLDLNWEQEFQALRQLSSFSGTEGIQQVGMIFTNGEYAYGDFDCGEMAIIPYSGDYAMAVILPEKGYSPQQAASTLMGRWDECSDARLYLSMPKLELNNTIDMMPMLDKLGFADTADWDFSGMLAESGSVGQILQGASLSITQTGTTAAAASGITIERGLFEPAYIMECNRPYATVIYHVPTGTVLFVSITNNISR